MTKINKLGKSTFVIAILSFLLVAVLAFGGTYAYFSEKTDTIGASFVTGTVKLDFTAPASIVAENDKVVPGQPLIGDPLKVSTTTSVDTVLIAVVEATSAASGITIGTAAESKIKLSINTTNWEEVTLSETGKTAYVYKTAATGGKYYFNDNNVDTTANEKTFTTEAIYLDKSVTGEENMGVAITLKVTFYIAQHDYLGTKNGDDEAGETAQSCYDAVEKYVYNGVMPVRVATGG